MPSTESDALRAHFQSMTDRMAANPEMDLVTLRSMLEELGARAGEPEGVSYAEADAGGVRALWCLPEGASAGHVVYYMHGGGFVSNTADSHRKLAGHLAKAIGARALVLDYRLAPEHPFPAQIEDAVAGYRWLLGQGIDAGGIITAGDSAGGNLAISLVLKLRDLGEPLPGAVIGFSPWLDMEHKGKTLDTNAATDALVQRAVIENMSAMFLGETGSPADPLANPLLADVAGLPPMYLSAGDHETLQDNAERFADKLRAAGIDVALEIAPGQQHVYPFMAGRAPEADATIAGAADWVRRHVGLS